MTSSCATSAASAIARPRSCIWLCRRRASAGESYTQQEFIECWQRFAWRSITQRFKSALGADGAQSSARTPR